MFQSTGTLWRANAQKPCAARHAMTLNLRNRLSGTTSVDKAQFLPKQLKGQGENKPLLYLKFEWQSEWMI